MTPVAVLGSARKDSNTAIVLQRLYYKRVFEEIID